MDFEVVSDYPLTPMQLGIVADQPLSGASSLDMVQVECVLEPELDREPFAAAWDWATARHDALRTAFRWNPDGSVRQELHAHAELPWAAVGADWERFLAEDRALGFVLDRPPLARCALQDAGPERRFAFSFHHSVLDGRSLVTLFREVFGRYDGLRGGPAFAPPPPPPFRAFVDWLAARDRSDDEPFWRDLLRGVDAPTLLLAGRGDRSETSHEELDLPLTPELSAGLRAVAERTGVTLNTVIQAAWAILLSRQTGRDDVVFGAVRSVRRGTLPGIEAMVGLLLNTVPVRARIRRNEPLAALLADLRGQAVAVRAHQHAPLMEVQRWARVPLGEPLFDTLVVYENFLLDRTLRAQGGDWVRRSFRLRRQPNYPLVLQVFAEPAVLVKLVHDPARVDSEAAGAIGRQLRTILESFAAEPTRRVADVPLLDPVELHRVLVQWNDSGPGRPQASRVDDLVLARAAAHPGAVAVQEGDRTLTYGELVRWAGGIARHLRAVGVGRGEVVAIRAEPSALLVAAELGVLLSGAACAPLDPAAPAERVAALLQLARASLVLTPHNSGLPEAVGFIDPGTIAGTDPERSRTGASTDPAFVLDTAGADQPPRPTALPHAALVSLAAWAERTCRLTTSDRVAVGGVVAHDASLLEVWPALAAGASLQVPSRHAHPTAGVPAVGGATVAVASWPGCGPVAGLVGRLATRPGALRAIVVVDAPDGVRDPTPPFDVHPLRGPTEAGLVAVDGDRPVAHTQVYVLDDRSRPMPPGAVGEVCVAGAGLAAGYLGHPALTADRFRPHPYARVPGARLHRTGDAGRHAPDGTLRLLGPAGMDHVVGRRIDPAPIEAALRRHPSVADAAVAGLDASGETARPAPGSATGGPPALAVAVVPAAPGQPMPLDELRRLLPRHSAPATIAVLPALPLTANGRLDRDALRAAAAAAADAQHPESDGTPDDALQLRVARLWAEVLNCDPDGERALLLGTESFFDRGGHSLFAITAALRLSDQLDADIPARLVFDAPTVPAFVDRLRRLLDAGGLRAAAPIVPLPRDG